MAGRRRGEVGIEPRRGWGGGAVDGSTVTDEGLIDRICRRDEHALALLYDRHARAAYGLALRIVWQEQAAEEVVQEAFLSVWRGAHRYRPGRGPVRTWLLAIVRNRAVDLLRGPGRHADRVLPLELAGGPEPVAGDDPEREALAAIEGHRVRAALAALPPEQRSVVELAYFAGLSHREVAAKTGVPLGTVKSRMRLALERLRGLLRAGEPVHLEVIDRSGAARRADRRLGAGTGTGGTA